MIMRHVCFCPIGLKVQLWACLLLAGSCLAQGQDSRDYGLECDAAIALSSGGVGSASYEELGALSRLMLVREVYGDYTKFTEEVVPRLIDIAVSDPREDVVVDVLGVIAGFSPRIFDDIELAKAAEAALERGVGHLAPLRVAAMLPVSDAAASFVVRFAGRVKDRFGVGVAFNAGLVLLSEARDWAVPVLVESLSKLSEGDQGRARALFLAALLRGTDAARLTVAAANAGFLPSGGLVWRMSSAMSSTNLSDLDAAMESAARGDVPAMLTLASDNLRGQRAGWTVGAVIEGLRRVCAGDMPDSGSDIGSWLVGALAALSELRRYVDIVEFSEVLAAMHEVLSPHIEAEGSAVRTLLQWRCEEMNGWALQRRRALADVESWAVLVRCLPRRDISGLSAARALYVERFGVDGLVRVQDFDPWGGAYSLRRRNDGQLAVVSAGEDRVFDTRDDVSRRVR